MPVDGAVEETVFQHPGLEKPLELVVYIGLVFATQVPHHFLLGIVAIAMAGGVGAGDKVDVGALQVLRGDVVQTCVRGRYMGVKAIIHVEQQALCAFVDQFGLCVDSGFWDDRTGEALERMHEQLLKGIVFLHLIEVSHLKKVHAKMLFLVFVGKEALEFGAVVPFESLENTFATTAVADDLGVADASDDIVGGDDAAVGMHCQNGALVLQRLVFVEGADGIKKEVFGQESGDSEEYPTSVGGADVFLAVEVDGVGCLCASVETHD